jgi:hypothetical protein
MVRTRTTPAQASTHLQGLRLFSKVDGNVEGEDVIRIHLLPARMWSNDAESAEATSGWSCSSSVRGSEASKLTVSDRFRPHLSPLSYSTSRKFSPLLRTVAGLHNNRQQQQWLSVDGVQR